MPRNMERTVELDPFDREGVTQVLLDTLGAIYTFGGQMALALHKVEKAPGEFEPDRFILYFNSWTPGLNLEVEPNGQPEPEPDEDEVPEPLPEAVPDEQPEPAVTE